MKRRKFKNHPPWLGEWLLKSFCSYDFLSTALWDLEEIYHRDLEEKGRTKAALLHLWHAIGIMYHLFSKGESRYTPNRTAMLKNNIITSFRSFKRNKIFSFINLSGLVLGMASCFIIVQYVYHEKSYDNFHTKKNNIYRLQQNGYYNDKIITSARTCAAIGPAIKENLPDIVEYVKLKRSNTALTYKNKVFKEPRAYYATNSFFSLFSFKLLRGVDSLVLKEPYSMVISESRAKKYFGDEDPIGKTMNSNGWLDFVVTGVFEDTPENTHLKVDILYSFETLVLLNGEVENNDWEWWSYWTYIELGAGVDRALFEQKLAGLVDEKRGEEHRKYNAKEVFELQPVQDIHLYSHFPQELEVNGNAPIVFGLLVIAFFILIIAWLNFISLSTASAIHRARETGIRKVMGSSRGQLIAQFLSESFLLNILAAGLALLLAISLLPYFESLAGKPLDSNLFLSTEFWIMFPVILLTGALLSGLYPAFIVSGYKPIDTLKGNFKSSTRGQLIRKSIVIFQFVISIVLIVATLTVYKQINYMQNKDLGVAIDQTIVINSPDITDSTYVSRYGAFKTELLSHPDIQGVTTSSVIPGNSSQMNSAGGVRKAGAPRIDGLLFQIVDIDSDFVPIYKAELIAGRNFSKDRNTNNPQILMNAKGVQYIGFENIEEAIGEKIVFWGGTYEIIGVLDNYHQDSPKTDFQATIYRPLWDDWGRHYSIKVDSKDIRKTLSAINGTFDEFFPGNPYSYFFLDDQYAQQYHSEELFRKLFNLFSVLSILIACLGLFGLSMYTVFQRKKEMGIRKVLGANAHQITLILSNQFLKIVIVAVVLGLPASWLIMRDWLNGFAFRVEMSWWHFFVPAVTICMIALLTVYQQVHKASKSNPIEALQQE